MSTIDWIVLCATLCTIIVYGVVKGKSERNLEGYFLSGRKLNWALVLLGIMGTQASAVTFLSAPGQAYTDGMRFVQYYFGLPLAMIFISIFFIPVFHRLKVFTPYEYLQQRFDNKTRTLTAFLFLLQRGLSTGISVFAPSLILSALLGWNIYVTNIIMGGMLIAYTISGGAKAVAYTQQLQFFIIFAGLFFTAFWILKLMPHDVGFYDVLDIGGKLNKLNIITHGIDNGQFSFKDQYNIWTGLIGGFFLMLSYFGTDQSQVGRYITAKSITESRIGILLNGIFKVPMQFVILMIGVLVFGFYQFNKAPVFFNRVQLEKLSHSVYKDSLALVNSDYEKVFEKKSLLLHRYTNKKSAIGDTEKTAVMQQVSRLQAQSDSMRKKVKSWIAAKEIGGDSNDTNYIFLRFVLDYLPKGLVGLLIAIIFLAAWGSIAAAVNSLASCSMIDIYKPFSNKALGEKNELAISKWLTLGWGLFCIVVAMFAYNIGNSLIEAVNILGSLFYGVILGIFLVAFFMKKIKNGNIVFLAAILSEIIVLLFFFLSNRGLINMSFLWLNPIGALGVMGFSWMLQLSKLSMPKSQV